MTTAHGVIEQHGAHIGFILVPTLLMLAIAFGAEARTWVRSRRTSKAPVTSADRTSSLRLAGHLSLIAGVIHLVAAPEHVQAVGALCVGDGAVRYRQVLEDGGATVPPDDDPRHVPRAVLHARLATTFGPVEEIEPIYVRAPDAERWRR